MMDKMTRCVAYVEFDAPTATEMRRMIKSLLDLGFKLELINSPDSENQTPDYSRVWLVVRGPRVRGEL